MTEPPTPAEEPDVAPAHGTAEEAPDASPSRTPMRERSLSRSDLAPTPMAQFAAWWAEWLALSAPEPASAEAPPVDAAAVALATASPDGAPSLRMVLLKAHDDDGFVFFTNGDSRKGRELAANPQAALLFHWPALNRQVRAEGTVAPLGSAESDAYFATRSRDSQLGTWASPQSQVLSSRDALIARMAEAKARFAGGPVPRPPHWGGYRLTPHTVEFWQGRAHRLHDRLRYRRAAGWMIERLAP